MADYPLDECADAAKRIVANGGTIFQKWTCKHCGARQTMDAPNRFFTSGKCEECQGVTLIRVCNYLVVMQFGT